MVKKEYKRCLKLNCYSSEGQRISLLSEKSFTQTYDSFGLHISVHHATEAMNLEPKNSQISEVYKFLFLWFGTVYQLAFSSYKNRIAYMNASETLNSGANQWNYKIGAESPGCALKKH